MAVEERMPTSARNVYLARMWDRYQRATPATRSDLLTEMETMTGWHRKSLIRRMHGPRTPAPPRRRPRSRVYGGDVQQVVRVVWERLDYVCAERLTPQLLVTARHLETFGELTLSADVERHLTQISRATVARRLRPLPRPTPRLPRKGPQEANHLRRAVAMGRVPWQTTVPGHCEVDLVHHCGQSAAGEYVHTLQLGDVATGWSERVAILGRGQAAMVAGFRRILARLPFALVHLHPDNGSEFFNNHLVRFFGEAITGLTLTRSRPYHKNDNRFVEQKNHTLVRAYLGYRRLDTAAQCAALNDLYAVMGDYYNLFQPVLHLVAKAAAATRVRRRWDVAQTPWQRLVATQTVTAVVQAQWEATYGRMNPRRVRRDIHARIVGLWEPEPAAVMVAE